ncbi:MAG TPA: glucosidase [Methylomirabilota bacterium]|nr:glucosidase [Methylomirabilota bacterium]
MGTPWKKWGPYLSERQWGTVREDYSENGNAWDYFSHDQARSRAYRWGEDGLAGISDDQQLLCFALALWNGKDPVLKERLFGLTNSEGNHGEDVKEYYFYLDSTPTHSYMKYLYKYPQRPFPYGDLISTNRKRGKLDLEYELLDTGVFNDNRYFDVFVEYAKQSYEDMLIQISVWNRGPEPAPLHVLPTLWFRNTWSWHENPTPKPNVRQVNDQTVSAIHAVLGGRFLYCDRVVPWLFTENETNNQRVFRTPNASPYVKDGINNYLINGEKDAVNPKKTGTKTAAHYQITVPAGGVEVLRVRLSTALLSPAEVFGPDFDSVVKARLREADDFYGQVIPPEIAADERLVTRQAFAGMLWGKQFYNYPVNKWIHDEVLPPDCHKRVAARNQAWFHLESSDIISMPDKWEYPWFAAWDLAFHCMVLARIDFDFAKEQLRLMTKQVYLHPSGQIPAYEWNFSDVNPPVHCKACWQVYLMEKGLRGKGDRAFLESQFHKLLMNFTWWVNRKDAFDNNVFEGGFLGLDNIGVFDRSAPLPTGGVIEQADGTSWMAMFSLDMLTIALELAVENHVYEELACKFFEHFIYIVLAMDRVGINDDELWDEDDGFFYDVLCLPNGKCTRLKVRSMVGLIPLFATSVFDGEMMDKLPIFRERVKYFVGENSALMPQIGNPLYEGLHGRRLLSPLNQQKLQRVLERMLDESEFFSPFGIRALSRYHKDHPYTFAVDGHIYSVDYEPAESSTSLFGGNSNWRGPIWVPVNALLIQSLRKLYSFYGDEFKVECPKGSGKQLTLWQVADEIARRLCSIFLRDEQGRRPVYGASKQFQQDPNWRDLILFYEYFHGDNGAGIGASHQTGWTGLVAWFMISRCVLDPKKILEEGFDAIAMEAARSD